MKTFKQFLSEGIRTKLAGAALGHFLSPGVKTGGREMGIIPVIRKGIEAVVPQDVLAGGSSPAEEERKESETPEAGFGEVAAIADMLGGNVFGAEVPTVEAGIRKRSAEREAEQDKKYLEGLSPSERETEQKRRQDMVVTRSQNAAKVQETMKRLDQQRGIFTNDQ